MERRIDDLRMGFLRVWRSVKWNYWLDSRGRTENWGILWSSAVCPLLIAEMMIEKDNEILSAVGNGVWDYIVVTGYLVESLFFFLSLTEVIG